MNSRHHRPHRRHPHRHRHHRHHQRRLAIQDRRRAWGACGRAIGDRRRARRPAAGGEEGDGRGGDPTSPVQIFDRRRAQRTAIEDRRRARRPVAGGEEGGRTGRRSSIARADLRSPPGPANGDRGSPPGKKARGGGRGRGTDGEAIQHRPCRSSIAAGPSERCPAGASSPCANATIQNSTTGRGGVAAGTQGRARPGARAGVATL